MLPHLGLDDTDSYADTYLLVKVVTATSEAKKMMGNALVVATIVSYCLAGLVSFLGLYLRVRVLLSLRKRRERQLSIIASNDAYTEKHANRRGKAKQSLQITFAGLLAGLLEDLPLSFIGLRFIQLSAREPDMFGEISFLLLLSTASSFFMVSFAFFMTSFAHPFFRSSFFMAAGCETGQGSSSRGDHS